MTARSLVLLALVVPASLGQSSLSFRLESVGDQCVAGCADAVNPVLESITAENVDVAALKRVSSTVNLACISKIGFEPCRVDISATYQQNPADLCPGEDAPLAVRLPEPFWEPSFRYAVQPIITIVDSPCVCDGADNEERHQVVRFERESDPCNFEAGIPVPSRYTDDDTITLTNSAGYPAMAVVGCTAADAAALRIIATVHYDVPLPVASELTTSFSLSSNCPSACQAALDNVLQDPEVQGVDKPAALYTVAHSGVCGATVANGICDVHVDGFWLQGARELCGVDGRLALRMPPVFWDAKHGFEFSNTVSIVGQQRRCDGAQETKEQVRVFKDTDNLCDADGALIESHYISESSILLSSVHGALAIEGCTATDALGVLMGATAQYSFEHPSETSLVWTHKTDIWCPAECSLAVQKVLDDETIDDKPAAIRGLLDNVCGSTDQIEPCDIHVSLEYTQEASAVCPEGKLAIKFPPPIWLPENKFIIHEEVHIVKGQCICDGAELDQPQARMYAQEDNICEAEGTLIPSRYVTSNYTVVTLDEGYPAISIEGCTAADAFGLMMKASTTFSAPHVLTPGVGVSYTISGVCPPDCWKALWAVADDDKEADKLTAIQKAAEEGCIGTEPGRYCVVGVTAEYIERAGERCKEAPNRRLAIELPPVFENAAYDLQPDVRLLEASGVCDSEASALYYEDDEDLCSHEGHALGVSVGSDDTIILDEPHSVVTLVGCDAAGARGLAMRATATFRIRNPEDTTTEAPPTTTEEPTTEASTTTTTEAPPTTTEEPTTEASTKPTRPVCERRRGPRASSD